MSVFFGLYILLRLSDLDGQARTLTANLTATRTAVTPYPDPRTNTFPGNWTHDKVFSDPVIIGSGILHAVGIRESGDVDVVTDPQDYERLDGSGRFSHEDSYGQTVLVDETFEIRTSWDVLGKDYRLEDFLPESVVIDGVRYITLDFLLAVKKSWLTGDGVRQKDIDDVELIETYLAKSSRS